MVELSLYPIWVRSKKQSSEPEGMMGGWLGGTVRYIPWSA